MIGTTSFARKFSTMFVGKKPMKVCVKLSTELSITDVGTLPR